MWNNLRRLDAFCFFMSGFIHLGLSHYLFWHEGILSSHLQNIKECSAWKSQNLRSVWNVTWNTRIIQQVIYLCTVTLYVRGSRPKADGIKATALETTDNKQARNPTGPARQVGYRLQAGYQEQQVLMVTTQWQQGNVYLANRSERVVAFHTPGPNAERDAGVQGGAGDWKTGGKSLRASSGVMVNAKDWK